MASVQAVCNTFLVKAFTESIPVTPMKLQKLTYFSYRDYLQETGNKAFNDVIQTWKYGPVVQSVYDEFKSFGAKKITRFARDAKGKVYVINDRKAPNLARCINAVWDNYKDYTGIELSKMTHRAGTAWSKAFDRKSPYLDEKDIMDEQRC